MTYDLADIADRLYVESEDDDVKLAELMHELPRDTAIALCTSNLMNALQVYMYAFYEVPDIDIYELLLLEPASSILYGIKIKSLELLDIVFSFDWNKKDFFIGVWDCWNDETNNQADGKFLAAFFGKDAYSKAIDFAEENC